MKETRYWQNV